MLALEGVRQRPGQFEVAADGQLHGVRVETAGEELPENSDQQWRSSMVPAVFIASTPAKTYPLAKRG